MKSLVGTNLKWKNVISDFLQQTMIFMTMNIINIGVFLGGAASY